MWLALTVTSETVTQGSCCRDSRKSFGGTSCSPWELRFLWLLTVFHPVIRQTHNVQASVAPERAKQCRCNKDADCTLRRKSSKWWFSTRLDGPHSTDALAVSETASSSFCWRWSRSRPWAWTPAPTWPPSPGLSTCGASAVASRCWAGRWRRCRRTCHRERNVIDYPFTTPPETAKEPRFFTWVEVKVPVLKM